MAYSQGDAQVPLVAASAMGANLPITFLTGGSALSNTVRQSASVNDLQFGISRATVAVPGDPVEYWFAGNVAKGIACASLGAGALVTVGSTNGKLIPIAASSGVYAWAIGISVKNAVLNDVFPIFIAPSLLT